MGKIDKPSPRDRALQKIKEAAEKQLEELDLSNEYETPDGDKLTKIPQEVFELKHLKILKLGYNKISHLPESIGNLTNLNELSLNVNQLTSLPESIGNLTSLNGLYLHVNQLTSLPESIDKLTSLNRLSLAENQLTSFPEFISKINSLNELSLWNNQLTSLPESIGDLANLNSLYLYENQLTSLPESIGDLASLKKLILWNNQLTSLPESIGDLANLNELNLWNNQLTSLPESIGNLISLNELDLNDNPLEEPPLEIADKGIEEIRQYFEQLKEGQDYIYEAKLLIVGEGGAGKTTLVKKILDPKYELQERQESTEGIDVFRWSFDCRDKEGKERKFNVNIWDFGGQEIYHATHQFFLTKRSLYSLVADSRKEHTDFYYWLNIVELLSDNSPLLIIKNEIQDRPVTINERALRGQFTNLKETLATNLATPRGMNEIFKNIKYYIQNLPHIGQALPKKWIKVRKILEEDKRNYISLQEYLDICQANEFTKLNYKLQLSEYLHDLGVCLHFQDQENSLLYKTIILKPTWGTDAVYKVLDNPQVVNNQGHFTWNDLKNIWQDDQYSAMRGELLELMKKFQLCYKIPEKENTFIAPHLLCDEQPEYVWNETNNLILRYSYPDFMPKGIITRFIVIMHQYIEDQDYVWKSGVILNKDNARAEVVENYGKREIKIRVDGNNKRNFLTIVSNEIDKINDSYEQLKYQKLIPCNCETCEDIQKPYSYKFDSLLERIANNQFTVQCDKPPYREVQITSLIEHSIDIQQLKVNEQINDDTYKARLNEKDKVIEKLFFLAEQRLEKAKVIQNFHGDVGFATGNVEQDQNIYNQHEEVAQTIQQLLDQIQQNSEVTPANAQQQTAKDLAIQAQNDPNLKERLLKLAQFVSENAGKTVVSEVVKGVIKLLLFML
ncbi:MAG: COR domain-containing protein [Cyanobacteria bacterium P01_F01_bin.143]